MRKITYTISFLIGSALTGIAQEKMKQPTVIDPVVEQQIKSSGQFEHQAKQDLQRQEAEAIERIDFKPQKIVDVQEEKKEKMQAQVQSVDAEQQKIELDAIENNKALNHNLAPLVAPKLIKVSDQVKE